MRTNDLREAAIVVAHPGHELMIHHWMELKTPSYYCVTDGSGGDDQPRIDSTSRLLHGLGAAQGAIYGRYSDKQVYRFLLEGCVDIFLALRDELAESLIDTGVAYIAGDAMEGFNPVHDLCRGLIDGAVARIRTLTGRELQNYEFIVEPARHAASTHSQEFTVRLVLDDAALERKITAAMAYPEMQSEVQASLDRFGPRAFAIESLRPSSLPMMLEQFEQTPPSYESFGQSRVREGRYREVIRHRAHVLPVFEALGIAVAATR